MVWVFSLWYPTGRVVPRHVELPQCSGCGAQAHVLQWWSQGLRHGCADSPRIWGETLGFPVIIQAGIGAGVGEWYAAATQAKDDRLQCCLGPKGQRQRQQTQPREMAGWSLDSGSGVQSRGSSVPTDSQVLWHLEPTEQSAVVTWVHGAVVSTATTAAPGRGHTGEGSGQLWQLCSGSVKIAGVLSSKDYWCPGQWGGFRNPTAVLFPGMWNPSEGTPASTELPWTQGWGDPGKMLPVLFYVPSHLFVHHRVSAASSLLSGVFPEVFLLICSNNLLVFAVFRGWDWHWEVLVSHFTFLPPIRLYLEEQE